MKDSQTNTANDIATEKYQGPGKAVASAGYAYISHAAAVITGVLVAGTAAYFAHRPIHGWIVGLRKYATEAGGFREKAITALFGAKPGSHPLHEVIDGLKELNPESKASLVNLVAKEEHGLFESVASKVTGKISKSKRGAAFMESQSEDRLSAVLIGGGIGGILGYIGSTVWAVIKGSHEGNRGKHQFEQKQREIKHLRDENSDLKRINEEIRTKYVEAASSIGRDEQPAVPSADISAAAAPATTLSNVAHMGTVAKAPELAAAH
jgi:hypothetical protein